MVAKSGHRLLDEEALAALRRSSCRKRGVLTPERAGSRGPGGDADRDARRRARGGRRILALGPTAVVVKGGHLPGTRSSTSSSTAARSTNSARRGCRDAQHAWHGLHLRVRDRRQPGARPAAARGGRTARATSPQPSSTPGIGRGHGPLGPLLGVFLRAASAALGSASRERYNRRAAMTAPLLALTPAPLDLVALVERVLAERRRRTPRPPARAGAVTTFIGHRPRPESGSSRDGARLRGLRAAGAARLRAHRREAAREWPDIVLGLHHRVGTLDIGEASIIIAAASPHRAEAFGACRYAIERVKQIAPIWKRESSRAATAGSKARWPTRTTKRRGAAVPPQGD